MDFTFGIITDGHSKYLEEVISSIDCPNVEIIVVGGNEIPNVNHIPFDESTSGWITKKKNIISKAAKHENIVYLHDYVSLCPGWYEGFEKFGNDWDVAMTRVTNKDGTRFRDWLICDDPEYCDPYSWSALIAPYDYDKTWWMYISGAYIVAKKDFMLKHPFNENLTWGQGEDVEWSRRVRHKWNYKLNLDSEVKLLKQQDRALKELINE